MERLDKIIASQTGMSRRDARRTVAQGRVSVNGAIEMSAARHADPCEDAIFLDGERIEYRKNVYYVLNKPKGVLSASRDKKLPTVVDLIEAGGRELFPVGRLDKDTTGLIIITDDGDFAHRLISPASEIEKEYIVDLDKPPAADAADIFALGIKLPDGTQLKSASLNMLGPTRASVIIREGRYHQIKRMFAAVRSTVLDLHRVRIGNLRLSDAQKPGEYFEMDFEQICDRTGIKNNLSL